MTVRTLGLSASARAVPYRAEIDGLRAVSVLAVILFHAKVPGFGDARFLTAAAGATVAIAVLGLALWRSDGIPSRLDETDTKLIQTDDRLQRDAESCALRSNDQIAAGSLCAFGPSSGASALVWGDSHALTLLPAYERIATQRGVRIHLAVRAACRPLFDAASNAATFVRRKTCDDFNRAAVGAIEALDPEVVILNAYWTFPDLSITATRPDADAHADLPPFEQAFERTLRAIGPERRVCVVDGYFADLQERHAFTLVEPKAVLCLGSTCAQRTADGRLVYRDDNHLTPAGALLLVDSLEACFDAAR